VLEQAGRAATAVMEGRDALGPRLLAAYNAQVVSRSLSMCTTNVIICNIPQCWAATYGLPLLRHHRRQRRNLCICSVCHFVRREI